MVWSMSGPAQHTHTHESALSSWTPHSCHAPTRRLDVAHFCVQCHLAAAQQYDGIWMQRPRREHVGAERVVTRVDQR